MSYIIKVGLAVWFIIRFIGGLLCCENESKNSGSIKGREFLDQSRNYSTVINQQKSPYFSSLSYILLKQWKLPVGCDLGKRQTILYKSLHNNF